jgi:hypothetical protein
MALAYQSTSVSDADAPSAAILAQSAIRDALLAHASGAWTLVEEFNSAGGTIHWVVIKNDHTISGSVADLFFVIGRDVASGQMRMFVGEVYTAATHTLSSFAPQASSSQSQNTILADFSYARNAEGASASYALGTTLPSGSQNPFAPSPTPLSTMRIITSVEKDYAILHVNATSVYVGALTDLIVPDAQLAAATPLGIIDLFGTGSQHGAFTRHPIDAANAPMQVGYSHMIYPFTQTWFGALQRAAMATSVYLYPDRYQGKKPAATEIMALMYSAQSQSDPNASAHRIGSIRGKYKGLRATTFPFAASNFDTIVVDGRKHVILSDKGMIGGADFFQPYDYYNKIKWGYVVDTGVAA